MAWFAGLLGCFFAMLVFVLASCSLVSVAFLGVLLWTGAKGVFALTRRAVGTCCDSALRALCRSQQVPTTRLLVLVDEAVFASGFFFFVWFSFVFAFSVAPVPVVICCAVFERHLLLVLAILK
jgi:hypothetical protein